MKNVCNPPEFTFPICTKLKLLAVTCLRVILKSIFEGRNYNLGSEIFQSYFN